MHLNPDVILVTSSVSFFTTISEMKGWNSSAAYEYAGAKFQMLARRKVIRGQSQKRMARWPKTNNGDEELYWKSTAFKVVLREACVF